MTPEEVKEITSLVMESISNAEGSNGPVYLLISIIVTVTPFALRYFKKAFVKAIGDAVEKLIESHKEDVSDLKKKVDKHEDWIDKLKHKCTPNESITDESI